jgi:hypothetical protein
MSASAFTVLSTKINAGLSGANTGAGTKYSDGSFNVTGTVIGAGQTIHSAVELARLGSAEGKLIPGIGGALAAGAFIDSLQRVSTYWENGQQI